MVFTLALTASHPSHNLQKSENHQRLTKKVFQDCFFLSNQNLNSHYVPIVNMKKSFYLENDIQNIDLKIHHRSCNEINLNNRNAFIQTYLIYINVTLIASNLGARDVIVHFEIVFIFFYLPFCRLSILKPGATLLKCGFSKFPHVRTIIFWDHIFPRISLVNFEPSASHIQKKTCQNATVLLSRSENFMTMARINFG